MTASFTRKGRVIVAAAIIALFSIPAGIAGPAAAAPPTEAVAKYVALGDSVAAGQGGGDYLDACLQSPAGYPVLLDAVPRTNLLRNAACTGATIADVATTQLEQVNRGTTLVTVTAGANGIHLQLLLAACAGGVSPECIAAIEAANAYLQSGEVPAELGSLIAAIESRSPRSQVVVTGYPIPFEPGLGQVTDGANALAFALNGLISSTVAQAAAQGADVAYADVTVGFAGHGVGSADPWLGANQADPVTFLHPNAAGYVVYRDAVLAATGP